MNPLMLLGFGLGGASLLNANQQQKRANRMEQRALDQSEAMWRQGAPLRQMGMTALGQIERPIDMGNHMYDSANPYAAARGPSPSTASLGNWGEMTFRLPQNFEQQTQEQMAQDQFSDAADQFARLGGASGEMGRKLQAEIARRRPGAQSRYTPVGYGWEG